ncbi:hypothetical protein [Zhihengliuella halotolerans]|uniref:hypothetical protein n=1 Tax=Zhihengliuella halotolerans TaxID=370736 RepID=UPI000C7FEC49|nr:hypothetical protein [Zhihengliuella halotolerans]
MTEVVLETMIGESDAQRLVRTKAPSFRLVRSELTYRPYSGFVHRLDLPRGRSRRVHTLVDRFNGKASVTGPWQTAAALDPRGRRLDEPQWGSLSFAEARRRALKAVAAAAPPLQPRAASPRPVDERLGHPTVWKPGWVLDGVVGGRDVRIFVDAVDGHSVVDDD